MKGRKEIKDQGGEGIQQEEEIGKVSYFGSKLSYFESTKVPATKRFQKHPRTPTYYF